MCTLKLRANLLVNFPLKMQLLGQLAFPINLTSLGLNLILEETLNSTEALNRLVKVPEKFYSYKQILKKHVRDIAGFSFSKEATLITAKKDDFINF